MSKVTKQQVLAGARQSINAVFVLGGLASVGFGAWQVYPPAAYMVVGAVVIYMGLPDK